MTDANIDEIDERPFAPDEVACLVAEGIVAMERGDEVDQEEMFARWRAKYG